MSRKKYIRKAKIVKLVAANLLEHWLLDGGVVEDTDADVRKEARELIWRLRKGHDDDTSQE